MADQRGDGSAHPYRVLVPLLPLRLVAEQTGAVGENVKLLRSRDSMHPFNRRTAFAEAGQCTGVSGSAVKVASRASACASGLPGAVWTTMSVCRSAPSTVNVW